MEAMDILKRSGYNYMAMDKNGSWHFFKGLPTSFFNSGEWQCQDGSGKFGNKEINKAKTASIWYCSLLEYFDYGKLLNSKK